MVKNKHQNKNKDLGLGATATTCGLGYWSRQPGKSGGYTTTPGGHALFPMRQGSCYFTSMNLSSLSPDVQGH